MIWTYKVSCVKYRGTYCMGHYQLAFILERLVLLLNGWFELINVLRIVGLVAFGFKVRIV